MSMTPYEKFLADIEDLRIRRIREPLEATIPKPKRTRAHTDWCRISTEGGFCNCPASEEA